MSHVPNDLTARLGKLHEAEAELETGFDPSRLKPCVVHLPKGYTVSAVDPRTIIRRCNPVPPYKATRESVQATISKWLAETPQAAVIEWPNSIVRKQWREVAAAAVWLVSRHMRHTAWASQIGYACARMYSVTYAINFGKGKGYGSATDVLDNFRQASKIFPWLPTPQDAVCFYMFKHADFLRKLNATGVVHGDEGVESRCADIILYAALGDALDKEDASNVQEQA